MEGSGCRGVEQGGGCWFGRAAGSGERLGCGEAGQEQAWPEESIGRCVQHRVGLVMGYCQLLLPIVM